MEFNTSIDHDNSRMWDDVGCDAGCWMTDRHMCKYETRTHVCTAVRVCVSTYALYELFGMCMLYSIVSALRKGALWVIAVISHVRGHVCFQK